jgi:hypothetical protein
MLPLGKRPLFTLALLTNDGRLSVKERPASTLNLFFFLVG